MHCGPNIHNWNKRFHGDNAIRQQRSDKDFPLFARINSLSLHRSNPQEPSSESHQKPERKILNEFGRNLITTLR